MPVSMTAYLSPLAGLLGIGLTIYLVRLVLSKGRGPLERVSEVRRLHILVELVAAVSLTFVPLFLRLNRRVHTCAP